MKAMTYIGLTTCRNGDRFTRRIARFCALSALAATGCLNLLGADPVRLPVASASASADDGNVAANTLDGSLTSRWSAQGDGQWIRFDLGSLVALGAVKIAWYRGNERSSRFDIQTSGDAANWTTVFSGASSGGTLGLESYDATDSVGRYVRIVGHGNSANTWNSITEVEAYGAGDTATPPPTNPPPVTDAVLSAASVTASSSDGANVPANTVDKNLATRWSALGDGQWIRFDLGSRVRFTAAKIAWYKGLLRNTRFDIQTSDSDDDAQWTTVFSGASSGSTLALETYPVSNAQGRYLRIVCHGSNLSLWNSLTEVEIYGTNLDGTAPPPPVTPPPPTNTPPSLPKIQKAYARLVIGSGKMPYYRNRPLDQYDPRVTRAIIVIHGAGANAEGYFDRVDEIIPAGSVEKTIVLAPYFQDPDSAASGEFWWDGDWREGGASGGISSYAVLDTMVALLRNGTFPNLKWVVIAGHSAGGQFTQRYAAFTDIDSKPAPNSAYVKFVPANPSSYVYLNEYRYGGNDNWVVPQNDCSSGDGYNEWKYGLEGLYGYTAARGANYARTHLPSCRVELLAGTADVNDDHGFDSDCPAMFQGPNRYERARIFDAFMDRFYPGNQFSVTPVPNIGHDSAAMFASPQGMNALFFAD